MTLVDSAPFGQDGQSLSAARKAYENHHGVVVPDEYDIHHSKRARGDLNGFQAFSEHKRRAVAAKAGRIGGARQRDLRLGIHGLSSARASEIGAMGGRASCDVNGWRTSEVQSANGKKGGPKSKGFRWYSDGAKTYKYTARQQADISFDGFLAANSQFQKGR